MECRSFNDTVHRHRHAQPRQPSHSYGPQRAELHRHGLRSDEYFTVGHLWVTALEPTITINQPDSSPLEAQSDGTPKTADFILTRTDDDLSHALTVGYTFGGDSSSGLPAATPGYEYTATGNTSGSTGQVTFAANSNTAHLTISPQAINNAEGDRSIEVSLNTGNPNYDTTPGYYDTASTQIQNTDDHTISLPDFSLVEGQHAHETIQVTDHYGRPATGDVLTVQSASGLNVALENGGVVDGDGNVVADVTTASADDTQIQLADSFNNQSTVQTYISAASVSVTSQNISGTAGVRLDDCTVATFISSNPSASASAFTATVDFGDGSGSHTFSVIPDPANAGQFGVVASHTYLTAGSFNMVVTVTQNVGGASATDTPVATIVAPADHQLIVEPGAADNALWYFGGMNPARYNTTVNADVTNDGGLVGTFAWSLSDDNATLRIGTDPNTDHGLSVETTNGEIFVRSEAATLALGEDTILTVTFTPAAGSTDAPFTSSAPIKIHAPASKVVMSITDAASGTGWTTTYTMQILDQFGIILPWDVPVNETFTGWVPDATGENWLHNDPTGTVLDPYADEDLYGSPPGVISPNAVNPKTPGWNQLVDHTTQTYYVGSTIPGEGIAVGSHVVNFYAGEARWQGDML